MYGCMAHDNNVSAGQMHFKKQTLNNIMICKTCCLNVKYVQIHIPCTFTGAYQGITVSLSSIMTEIYSWLVHICTRVAHSGIFLPEELAHRTDSAHQSSEAWQHTAERQLRQKKNNFILNVCKCFLNSLRQFKKEEGIFKK